MAAKLSAKITLRSIYTVNKNSYYLGHHPQVIRLSLTRRRGANSVSLRTWVVAKNVIKIAVSALILLTIGSRNIQAQLAGNGHSSSGHAPATGHMAAVSTGQLSMPRQPAYSSQKITLDMRGNLQEALDVLFRQSHVNYVYALRGVTTKTAHIKLAHIAFDDALNKILRAYPTQPPIRPHIMGTVVGLMQIDLQHPSKNGKARTVTLRLQHARLQDAFRALFAALGTDYTLDNGIQGFATLAQRGVSYRSVIAALMAQSAQPLALTDRGNYFIIKSQAKKVFRKAKR